VPGSSYQSPVARAFDTPAREFYNSAVQDNTEVKKIPRDLLAKFDYQEEVK